MTPKVFFSCRHGENGIGETQSRRRIVLRHLVPEDTQSPRQMVPRHLVPRHLVPRHLVPKVSPQDRSSRRGRSGLSTTPLQSRKESSVGPKIIVFLFSRESQDNMARVWTGQGPSPLSNRGRQDVIETVTELWDWHLSAILASPVIRAWQTAAFFRDHPDNPNVSYNY